MNSLFKFRFLMIASMVTLMMWQCSPTVTESVNTDAKPEQNTTQTTTQKPQKESKTTCKTLADLPKAERSDVEDAFTLYRDQIRFKRYPEARALWRKAYYSAPGANGRVTYHFDDGIKVYDYMFKNAKEGDPKAGWVDTILSVYDKRMECFEDDGTILARKAFNSYYTYDEYVPQDQIFNGFKTVLEKKGDTADYFIVNPLSRMIYDRVLDEKIAHDEASEMIYQIHDVIERGMANCEGEYCDAWDVINEYSPNLLAGLEGIKGFYNCQYYVDRYYKEFLADSTNCDVINEVYYKMRWASCDPELPELMRIKKAKETECYVAPPPPGALKQGYMALNEGRFREAIGHYEKYVSETDDPMKKADKLLLIAKIYYAHIKNFSESRRYARKALEHRPNWGAPYMLIGKLYASSGPLCGPGRGWDSQIVTWPAIDKFQKAKSVDPSVTDEANKWIYRYQKYMPSVEDIFIRQLTEGQSFRVGCWIQENTRIRAAKG